MALVIYVSILILSQFLESTKNWVDRINYKYTKNQNQKIADGNGCKNVLIWLLNFFKRIIEFHTSMILSNYTIIGSKHMNFISFSRKIAR